MNFVYSTALELTNNDNDNKVVIGNFFVKALTAKAVILNVTNTEAIFIALIYMNEMQVFIARG